MKLQLLLTLVLGISVTAIAQQDRFAKKYAAGITAAGARKHLSILASDEFEGRETGKPGAEKAARYIKAEFQRLGLKGIVNGDYFQELELYTKAIAASNLAINGKPLEAQDFAATAFIGPKETFTDFVFIGYGIQSAKYDDLSAANIAGKTVIVLPGEPKAGGNYLSTGTTTASEWTTNRTKKLAAIRDKKPALIINVASAVASGGRAAGVSYVFTKENKAALANSITLSTEAVNMLMASTGRKVQDLQISILQSGRAIAPLSFTSSLTVDVQTVYTPVDAKEVLGFMEGSDAELKKEVLVFSAHYDHIGLTRSGTDKVNNGADDDGSGTTGILQIAAAFSKAKKDKHGPKRSLLFLANTGEEKGLLGSEYYTDHPVIPLENTIADLNIDMIGRIGEEYLNSADSLNYVYVIGSEMLSSTLKKVSEHANSTYLNMKLDYKYDDLNDPNRYYYRSDHYNFAKHNVPIIFYFNGIHADYHGAGDEVSKINFPLLAKRAQLAFYTGWELANRPGRPVVDVKPGAAMTNR